MVGSGSPVLSSLVPQTQKNSLSVASSISFRFDLVGVLASLSLHLVLPPPSLPFLLIIATAVRPIPCFWLPRLGACLTLSFVSFSAAFFSQLHLALCLCCDVFFTSLLRDLIRREAHRRCVCPRTTSDIFAVVLACRCRSLTCFKHALLFRINYSYCLKCLISNSTRSQHDNITLSSFVIDHLYRLPP